MKLENTQITGEFSLYSRGVVFRRVLHKVCACVSRHYVQAFVATGSFKIRGVLNQMLALPAGCGSQERPLISMSAGNYGRSFAFLCSKMRLTGHIVMPDTAPDNRAAVIQVRAQAADASHRQLLCKR